VSDTTASDPRLGGRAVRRMIADAATIAARVGELGAEITAAYPSGDLLVIGMLKGSFVFLADLVRAIRRPLHVDFLVASSYGSAMTTSGRVEVAYRPRASLAGRHVLLVEDVVDSGTTLVRVMDELAEQGPLSLDVCALLHKRQAAQSAPAVRFVGFDAPQEFLVGYGLDHAEEFRHLPYIVSLQ
jgi:hypoxanthine phosphoribosyltransferase